MRSLRLALAALAVALAAPALAQTATATLAVSATVGNNCNVTANAISFGSYDSLAAGALDAAGSVVVTCTQGASWWIGLGAGSGGPAAGVTRSMSQGASRLGYDLYSDGTRSTLWANAQAQGVSGTGSGAAQTTPVYGRIPAGQTTVPAGPYADTVVATVNF